MQTNMGNIPIIYYSTINIWWMVLRDAPKTKLTIFICGHKKYLIICWILWIRRCNFFWNELFNVFYLLSMNDDSRLELGSALYVYDVNYSSICTENDMNHLWNLNGLWIWDEWFFPLTCWSFFFIFINLRIFSFLIHIPHRNGFTDYERHESYVNGCRNSLPIL